jgi:hypothetical protein
LYGGETWSVTLREEHTFRAFENRVLRTIFGPKSKEVARVWTGEDYVVRSFITCTLHQILIG